MLTGIICPKSDYKIAIRSHQESVSTHRASGKFRLVRRIGVIHVVIAANDYLEIVAVKMKRVLAGVVVVEDDFYDFVLL